MSTRSPRLGAAHRAALAFAFLPVLLALSACQPGTTTASDPTEARTSPAAMAEVPAEEVSGRNALIWVNGMGCPLCSSNVDKQLRAVPGVERVSINLGTGQIVAALDPSAPPTQAQLERAIANSGFTLVRIQMP